MTTPAQPRKAVRELEAPAMLLVMLLYIGFSAFVMLQWGGLASALERGSDDTESAPTTSLTAIELE